MARILSIDYGTKKCGIAATDPLQLIVNGLTTIATSELVSFLKEYIAKEEVIKIVLGLPHHPDGHPAQLAPTIQKLAAKLTVLFPGIECVVHDETYTTKQAKQILLKSGLSKKKRRDKSLVDKISAVLILQDYLQHI